VCMDDCEEGVVYVTVRAMNRASEGVGSGVDVALYAVTGDERVLVATTTLTEALAGGWATDGLTLPVDAALLADAESLVLMVDDDGEGIGIISECSEANNDYVFPGPFCE